MRSFHWEPRCSLHSWWLRPAVESELPTLTQDRPDSRALHRGGGGEAIQCGSERW